MGAGNDKLFGGPDNDSLFGDRPNQSRAREATTPHRLSETSAMTLKIMPSVNMTAVNPATAQNIAASKGQPLNATDQVPQHVLDAMLWHYRHGFKSQAPPPGPNASTQDSKEVDDEAIDSEELAREIRRISTNPYEK